MICHATTVIERTTTIERTVSRDKLANERYRAEQRNHEQGQQDQCVFFHDERMRSNEKEMISPSTLRINMRIIESLQQSGWVGFIGWLVFRAHSDAP